jgi:hypothetical protein
MLKAAVTWRPQIGKENWKYNTIMKILKRNGEGPFIIPVKSGSSIIF